jgi:hypothetical protein
MSIKPFPLGTLVATPDAMSSVPNARVVECLIRHVSGDWGDLSAADIAENNLSVLQGFRILSAYYIDENDKSKGKFWIITEADRSSTCILLPENY